MIVDYEKVINTIKAAEILDAANDKAGAEKLVRQASHQLFNAISDLEQEQRKNELSSES